MTASLLLVERNAAQVGGHHHAALAALARQAVADGLDVVVAAPLGITDETRRVLPPEVRIVAFGSRPSSAAIMLAAARGMRVLSRIGVTATESRRLPRPVRRFPHQLTMLDRALTEAAALRIGARACRGRPPVVVVLTATEGLHTLVAAMSGVAHLRFVHELDTTEDAAARLLGRATRRSAANITLLCPTEAVSTQLRARFPGLDIRRQPFAIADPDAYVADIERAAARVAYGADPGRTVLGLIGGWWPHKDILAVCRALALATRDIDLIAAGQPMDPEMLAAIAALPNIRLHRLHAEVTSAELRRIYAACDAVMVARSAGVRKESGLVADAANYGVAALVATDDPDLVARLQAQPWVTVVAAGDSAALAAAIDTAALCRPGPTAAADIGFPTAAEAVDTFTRLTVDIHRRTR